MRLLGRVPLSVALPITTGVSHASAIKSAPSMVIAARISTVCAGQRPVLLLVVEPVTMQGRLASAMTSVCGTRIVAQIMRTLAQGVGPAPAPFQTPARPRALTPLHTRALEVVVLGMQLPTGMELTSTAGLPWRCASAVVPGGSATLVCGQPTRTHGLAFLEVVPLG